MQVLLDRGEKNFRYLNHTKDKILKLRNTVQWNEKRLIGYEDADWGGDMKNRKSNSGYIFMYLGASVAWTSHKQAMVTLSSTEAEYIALTEASQEAVRLRRILDDLQQIVADPPLIYEDNPELYKNVGECKVVTVDKAH